MLRAGRRLVRLRRIWCRTMAMLALPLESLVSVPLQVAVLDPGGIIREVNAGWRSFAAENALALADSGVGTDYLSHCTPDQAAGLTAVIGGRCDVFTAVYPCHANDVTRWMLMVGLPMSTGRPRRIAVMHLEISALLPFDPGRDMLRATHYPEVLPANTVDAIVQAVEHALARTMTRPLPRPDLAESLPVRTACVLSPPVTAGLPKRQREVLTLLGEGMSNSQIAGVLGISMNTAKLHVSAVLRRLGLDNRMQAVALGARLATAHARVEPAAAE
jgi:DNA-binding CsgD family transcriptional regulator